MCAVDVCAHGRKTVGEAFGDEALRRQVITFVEVILADDAKDARVTFERRGMQFQIIEYVNNPTKAALGVFKRNSTHKAVHFIAQFEQVFGQITAVLSGYARDKRPLTHGSTKVVIY